MSEPSTSRERIIPILIEGAEEEIKTKEKKESSPEPVLTPLHEENDLPKETPMKRTLPMCNVKEKIILVLDSAEDEDFTPFKLDNSDPQKPLEVLKRSIEIFLNTKHLISKKHEYALAVMNENSVVWLVDFTNNINKIVHSLQTVSSCETEDIFDLNSLFDVILQHVQMPDLCKTVTTTLPPPYVVRVILMYGRSYTMPRLHRTDEIDQLLDSPYFTLDVTMTHESVDDDNNCNKIFGVLQNLDQKGFAYFFPVARDAKRLFGSMGKLLGHPLQRPTQKFANYTIKEQ